MTSPSSLQIAPSDMLLMSAINLVFYFVTHIQNISFPVDLVFFTRQLIAILAITDCYHIHFV